MGVLGFLAWLHDTAFSVFLRESNWGEPVVESVHVLGLTLFLGFAVLLDLRLLGACMQRRSAAVVLAQLNPWLQAGFALMIGTGVLLFIGDPVQFYENVFFRIKMLLLAAAVANVLVFNVTVRRRIRQWDGAPKPPGGVAAAAVLSLVLWAAIVAAGRAIAYTLPPP